MTSIKTATNEVSKEWMYNLLFNFKKKKKKTQKENNWFVDYTGILQVFEAKTPWIYPKVDIGVLVCPSKIE